MFELVCKECRQTDPKAPIIGVLSELRLHECRPADPVLLIRGKQLGSSRFGTVLRADLPWTELSIAPIVILSPAPAEVVQRMFRCEVTREGDWVRATRHTWHWLRPGVMVEVHCHHRHRLVVSVETAVEAARERLAEVMRSVADPIIWLPSMGRRKDADLRIELLRYDDMRVEVSEREARKAVQCFLASGVQERVSL